MTTMTVATIPSGLVSDALWLLQNCNTSWIPDSNVAC
jgi:hypothetical protein